MKNTTSGRKEVLRDLQLLLHFFQGNAFGFRVEELHHKELQHAEEAFALVKEADATGTSPGKDVLKTLLETYAPCVFGRRCSNKKNAPMI